MKIMSSQCPSCFTCQPCRNFLKEDSVDQEIKYDVTNVTKHFLGPIFKFDRFVEQNHFVVNRKTVQLSLVSKTILRASVSFNQM